MKTFITGATGFVGSRVAERLAQGGHPLKCLVRRMSPAAERLRVLGAELVTGDITDRESVRRGMGGCGWVIHVAGLYSFWEPDRHVFRETNVTGTRNVMECALEAHAAKVVHVSTVGIFGKPAACPFTEDTPVGPVRVSDYFRTKYEGDRLVWDLFGNSGLPVVVIYPAAVLGPGDPKTTGQYISGLMAGKIPATVFDRSVFTFVDVRDVAEAIVRAAERDGTIGRKYIVAAARLSFGEIVRMVGEIAGVPLPKLHMSGPPVMAAAAALTAVANVVGRRPPWGLSTDQMKVMRMGCCADGSRAERELGIRYRPIRSTLEEAVASFRR